MRSTRTEEIPQCIERQHGQDKRDAKAPDESILLHHHQEDGSGIIVQPRRHLQVKARLILAIERKPRLKEYGKDKRCERSPAKTKTMQRRRKTRRNEERQRSQDKSRQGDDARCLE